MQIVFLMAVCTYNFCARVGREKASENLLYQQKSTCLFYVQIPASCRSCIRSWWEITETDAWCYYE